MVAAMLLTIPSRPRLSKNTVSLVSHWPGRISSDSFSASPYRSLRAATVTKLPRGAVTGTSRRLYMTQANAGARQDERQCQPAQRREKPVRRWRRSHNGPQEADQPVRDHQESARARASR